jgi:hypothetical protein
MTGRGVGYAISNSPGYLKSGGGRRAPVGATNQRSEKMPLAFEKCVLAKGTVTTVKGPNKQHGLKAGEYCRYCIKGGKSFRGEVKKSASNPMAERLKHDS